MMDSENSEVEIHARDSEPSSSGPPSEVEARTEDDTERREESDISAPANQVGEELGTSSLSAANTSSSTLFFSPSCFHTPAAGSLRRFGGEEDTVFKTARSHLDTAESPTPTRPRFRRLDGLRAPCFNVTGESASKPLSQELNSKPLSQELNPKPLSQELNCS